LDYHLYSHPAPNAFLSTHFVSDVIREELHKRSEASQLVPLPGHNLPDELQGYHSLALLEPSVTERRKFFSWYSTVYRATSSNDGVSYALRRVESLSYPGYLLRIVDLCRFQVNAPSCIWSYRNVVAC
jgi:PAB-dependent poly(A)-specific ribonuclease subunit 3